MVKVFIGTENEYYLDGFLKDNLDIAKEVIKKDWDMIFCYDGYEGSGKSVKAMQDAYYCDPSFTIERECFTPKEFTEQILKAEKYQAVVYDEALTGLSSKDVMGRINKALVSMLAEIRQKNLFVFIVMPTFFDLSKYVALWRSRALIHLYTAEKFKRGYFAFFNSDRKKELYIKGKKFYDYNCVKPNFKGMFTGYYPIDEEAYKKKKLDSLKNRAVESNKPDTMDKKKMLFEALYPIKTMTHREKYEAIGISEAGFYKWKQKYENKG